MASDELFFLITFDLRTKTGTPTRSRTTIEIAKELAKVRVLSTAPYDSETTDFTTSIDAVGQSNLRKNLVVFRLTNFFRFPIIAAMLFIELVKSRPKKIYCIELPSALIGFFYKKIFGAKMVFEVHALGIFHDNIFAAMYEGFLVKNSDLVVATSKKMKKYFIKKYDANPEKICLVYGPVPIPESIKTTKKTKFTVGYGGNDSYYQGVDTLLTAAGTVTKNNKNINFVFVGFDAAKYKKFASENIEIYPKTNDDKKFLDILGNCDVLLCGYRGKFAEYVYPHKVSTYFSLGKPVISTSTGDLKELIEGNNCGETFPENDSEKLAELIIRFSKKNKKELETMGKNSLDFAIKNFSKESFKKRLKSIIDL